MPTINLGPCGCCQPPSTPCQGCDNPVGAIAIQSGEDCLTFSFVEHRECGNTWRWLDGEGGGLEIGTNYLPQVQTTTVAMKGFPGFGGTLASGSAADPTGVKCSNPIGMTMLNTFGSIVTILAGGCGGGGGPAPPPAPAVASTHYIDIELSGINAASCTSGCQQLNNTYVWNGVALSTGQSSAYSLDLPASCAAGTGFNLLWAVNPLGSNASAWVQLRRITTGQNTTEQILAEWRYDGYPAFMYDGGQQIMTPTFLPNDPLNWCGLNLSTARLRSYKLT